MPADAQSAALPDGEVVDPRVRADRCAVRRHHLARPDPLGRAQRHEASRIAARDEADLLRVGLLGDGQVVARSQSPHLRLRQVAHREEHVPERILRKPVQEVALVLLVPSGAEREPISATLDASVVAGSQLRPEGARALEQPRELHRVVALDARIGRAAAHVIVDEGVDHGPPEVLLQVRDVERDPEHPRGGARVLEVVRATAGAATGGIAVVEHAHRDAEHVVTRVPQQGRGNGRVDSPGHGDQDAQGGRVLGHAPEKRAGGSGEAVAGRAGKSMTNFEPV